MGPLKQPADRQGRYHPVELGLRLFCQWRPKSFVLCNQNRAAEYACVDSIFHTASIGLGTSFMPARLRRSGIHCRCRVVELSGLQRPGELVNTEDPEGIARRDIRRVAQLFTFLL